MSTYRVHFLPDDVTVEVEDGAILLQAAMRGGVHINASCGGEGACGKCRVILESGQIEYEPSHHINQEDYEKGYRLACRTRVRGDLEVRVPVESQFSAQALNRARPSVNAAREAREFGVETLKEQSLFKPPHDKLLLTVDPPGPGDNITDLDRLINSLKFEHDVHNLDVDFQAIQAVPRVLRTDDFQTTVTLAYPTSFGQEGGSDRIHLTHVQPGDRAGAHYALAVDIGTTTIFVQLLDLNTGESLGQLGDFNRQISYGEDVITRILFAGKGDGLSVMQTQVVETINELIHKLCRRAKVDPEDITMVNAAGNTTMTQLFLAVDPTYIRLSPYVPTATYYPSIPASSVGLDLGRHTLLNVFPAAASYVGGDIVSGLLAAGVHKSSELTLYIDLGTNGEIVIGNQDWLACAACSAGPAFEGGGVKFGMRATAGAIEDFTINPTNLEPMILTVEMKKPKGICGSGLINIVAGLFEMGVINERGKFEQDLGHDRIREGEDGWEYVLSWADESQVGRDIVITEIDIENLIRAKAAMYAGYQCLLESVGLTVASLDRVIIAGGFGRYINLEKSITIGLLPELELDKFTFIGNGSLAGARLTCLSNHLRYEVKDIESKMTNFELSEVPTYMDYYVASQFIPHTRRECFPDVLERVSQTRQLIRAA